ncbi:MAG: hypothetical protein CMM15_07530 [Rhodospirillaceae bacterium]|nr:hypothetical protein [Rhodospirillaceae bacterium]|tara:strand:+ start:3379 stop:4455 length:1077 start_codon:yes stop_codon:yes gene_type:complete
MSWDVFVSLSSLGVFGKLYAITDNKLLIMNHTLTLLHRRTLNTVHCEQEFGIQHVLMNENYIVYLKHEMFEPYWCIEIFRHGEYKTLFRRIVHRKKIYPQQFSLDGHLLGLVTMNTLYAVYYTVMDIRNGESVHYCCERKMTNIRTPFFYLYAPPLIFVYNDLVVQTFGTNQCTLYRLSSSTLYKRIHFPGVILQLTMNDKNLVVLIVRGNAFRIVIQNLETGKRTHYFLPSESSPQKGMIKSSSMLLVFATKEGLFIVFDFRVGAWYRYDLNCTCHTIVVQNNMVYLSVRENNFWKVMEISFTMIPTRELFLFVYKGILGNVDENYDLKRYLLEFIGPPVYRGPIKTHLFLDQLCQY